MIRQFVFCSVTLVASAALAQSDPAFPLKETAGRYGVGLKVVEQYDFSRIYASSTDELGQQYRGERARPLQTLIWYPAERTEATSMTAGDYLNLWKSEIDFENPVFSAGAKEWLMALRTALNERLWAVRDAREVSGRFPVIIYAPSHSSFSWENADLCEYLASHGYVVLASPSFGATTRQMTSDLKGVRTQARDVTYLIGYAQTLSNTDLSRVAAVGFSWGGLSNLFAAAQDDRIDALIALDGSQRYYPALVKQGDVHPEQMTIPLLYFARGEFSTEDQARYSSDGQYDGPNVLNAWTHGDLTTVRLLGLLHAQFSSMFLRNEELWANYFLEQQKADYGRKESIESYSWMARYALAFLNAYLKGDAQAKAYLQRTPAENGVPKHFMAVSHRLASGIPASFESFRAQIGRRGFDHASKVLAAFKKHEPKFTLEEGNVNAWAEELIDEEHWREAIALLQLNVQIRPDSNRAHVSLARAYELSGQKSLAIQSYQRALELNPLDAHASKKLKALLDKYLH